jgi:hypothetical protein
MIFSRADFFLRKAEVLEAQVKVLESLPGLLGQPGKN